MLSDAILFSIQPKYADKIFEGKKTVELRRVRPKRIREGVLALIYVSSPVKSLSGAFIVDRVVEKAVVQLWQDVKNRAGITFDEYENYFEGTANGIAIFFSDIWRFQHPIKLHELRENVIGFSPPQSFRYATKQELSVPKVANLLDGIA
jgi:predicted transcriptional regulator